MFPEFIKTIKTRFLYLLRFFLASVAELLNSTPSLSRLRRPQENKQSINLQRKTKMNKNWRREQTPLFRELPVPHKAEADVRRLMPTLSS